MHESKKLCVFCGKDETYGPMNVEHVVPRALWNRKRPNGTKTVPAHVECNRQSSDDIDYFRDFLAMDEAASRQPDVQELLKGKLKRKIDQRAPSIRREMRPIVLPNITPSNLFLGHAVFMRIDAQRIVRVLRNIARSLHYNVTGRLVPIHAEIAVIHLDATNLIQLGEFVRSLGKTESLGDDVFRFKHSFEPDAMACVLEFYRTRKFLCHAIWDEPEIPEK